MTDLAQSYSNVGLVVKLRPDGSEYLVCADIDGHHLPIQVLSISKMMKYLSREPDDQSSQQQQPAEPPAPTQ